MTALSRSVAAVVLLAVGSLHAQTYEQLAPKTPAPSGAPELPAAPMPAATGDDRVLVQALKGLVLVPDARQVQPAGLAVSGIEVRGLPVLQGPEFSALLARHLGQPVSFRLLNEISREIVLYCRRHDRPIVDVVVPEQNVSAGVVQLVVTEGRLGRVAVEGARWFSAPRIMGPVRVRSGEVITGRQLLEDLDWINQNPFRQVDLVFARGAQAGETDVILRTTDRRPLRVYAGYENSGNALTGEDRVQAGVNWGNAFGLDQLLNYQFTASPDLDKLVAHSGSYVIPIAALRHTVTFFGSYAESRPELPGGFFDLTGCTWQASARYRVPLKTFAGATHALTAGVDFKRSNNDLAFGGMRVFAQETDVAQLLLTYDASRPDRFGSSSVSLSGTFSPGGLTSGAHTSRYRAARAYADPEYTYGRLTFERVTRLPAGLSWQARATGQLASTNLLGSEQLGLGGYDTVRGYEEREANGDDGFFVTNELQGPAWRLASRLGARLRQTNDRLIPLVFIDYGWVKSHRRLVGEPKATELASVGFGFRYQLATNLTARFDYGWQLHDTGLMSDRESSRAHVGLTLAY